MISDMKKKKRKLYVPRLVPKISTSSKVFLDKKTKSKHRRVLNKEVQDFDFTSETL